MSCGRSSSPRGDSNFFLVNLHMSQGSGSKTLDVARSGGVPRYARLYLAMWKNSVVREMSFKANFLLWIFVELLWFALQLSFFAVIYSHTDHIADWTKWQVVLLIGTGH